MNRLFLLLLLFGAQVALAQRSLPVMTFNIRYDNPRDSANAWPHRVDKVISQIRFHAPAVIGVQEALHHQLTALQEGLPGYRFLGVGRDDGKQKGEYSAILYDTTRLELLRTDQFWLSEQPEVPGSKSWDAAITRLATWARFRDRATKKTFYFFNTHFDHIGKQARAESARLILRRMAGLVGKDPVILTGDLNTEPTEEPYGILTATNQPFFLTDAKKVSRIPHYGPEGTFNSFGPKETSNRPIDYILFRGPWTVQRHATLSQTWGGRFSSDHFPVLAILNGDF